jgi:hypothetical protein
VPRGANIVVVSRGDNELLKYEDRQAWHFPQEEGGGYAGHYPGDSNEAIEHLEWLRSRGADYLLFPATSLWWLEHYAEFRKHLETNYRTVANYEGTCRLFEL